MKYISPFKEWQDYYCPLTPPCTHRWAAGRWVCVRKLTGRELPSPGELLATQRADSKYCGKTFIPNSLINYAHITWLLDLEFSRETWAKRPQEQTGNSTVSWPGKPLRPPGFRGFRGRIGWRQTSVGSSGDKGRTSTSSSPTSISRIQPLPRCQESYKGQKSAPTAVRQVGTRKINRNRYWNNTSGGRHVGTTRPRLLSLSAGPQSRETARASELRLGPKINWKIGVLLQRGISLADSCSPMSSLICMLMWPRCYVRASSLFAAVGELSVRFMSPWRDVCFDFRHRTDFFTH